MFLKRIVLSIIFCVFLGTQPVLAFGLVNPVNPVVSLDADQNTQVTKVKRRGIRLPRTVPIVIPMTGGYQMDALTALLLVIGMGVIGRKVWLKVAPDNHNNMAAYQEIEKNIQSHNSDAIQAAGTDRVKPQFGQRGAPPAFGKR